MSMFTTHNWDQWVKGEFKSTMRAKGKMDETKSIAKQRKEEALFGNSKDRIFHIPIENEPVNTGSAAPSPAGQQAGGSQRKGKSTAARAELRAQLARLEGEVAAERAARDSVYSELSELASKAGLKQP